MKSCIPSRPSGTDNEIEPSGLLLDSANVRLLEHVSTELLETPADQIGTSPIQERLLQLFKSEPRFKVDSLVSSIRSLGFLRNDRLIVARYDGDRHLVLEGNRRFAAVKLILRNKSDEAAQVLSSLETLPCYVLEGAPISGDEAQLKKYRDLALQYIGIRHLTGIQQWEPASRYEFLARLIDESGMTPQDVSQRFGYPLSAVLRDYRAHLLYRLFRDYETSLRLQKHRLTYNAFSEATRSPDIRDWLGWADHKPGFDNEAHVRNFFDYVVKQLGLSKAELLGEDSDEEETWTPEESAEGVVRRYRDLLKRKDPEISSNLEQGNYPKAHELFELRRAGKLEQRLKSYISGIKSVSKSEMQESPAKSARLLDELSREALDLKSILESLAH